jgi:hypothetical protein
MGNPSVKMMAPFGSTGFRRQLPCPKLNPRSDFQLVRILPARVGGAALFTRSRGASMRAFLMGATILLLAGCAGNPQPVQLTGPAPAMSSETLACVSKALTDRGYTVDPPGADQMLVRGTHVNEQPWWMRIFGYRDTADQITASVNQGQLQVTAVSSDPSVGATATVRSTATTSGAARRDAQEVIASCSA